MKIFTSYALNLHINVIIFAWLHYSKKCAKIMAYRYDRIVFPAGLNLLNFSQEY